MTEIEIKSAASAAIASLSHKDRVTVKRTLQRISAGNPKRLIRTSHVRSLGRENKYYTLRASNDLRIIFQVEKARKVNVLDIVRKSTAQTIMGVQADEGV